MHGHNIHSLATVNYQLPRGETLFHLPLTHILDIIQRLFTNNPKIFKDFFACKFVLAAIHQQPGNILRLSCLQNCLSRKSSTIFRKYSKTFWAINSSNQKQQPATAINSNNQQQQPKAATSNSNQQQQPAAAINSNNQQQQSTAAINSSNQQQQSTAAINSVSQQQHPTTTINYSDNQPSSYQHHFHNPRRPTLDNITVPSTGYVLLEVDLGLAARLRVQSPLPRTIFVTF